jgi:hypothetical protein
VLIVADPAQDAHLEGAQEEGAELADLFRRFNDVYKDLSPNRIAVVDLLGPDEATREKVLQELTLRHFDVLHFAGHCRYNKEDPSDSGWVFSGGTYISANELRQIDRIPKFVFSNSCESGVTPDRSERRSVALAPTFAESFFARGVSNFVCTAWSINDAAALMFARVLYMRLLGLESDDTDPRRLGPVTPQVMHIAMRDARRAVLAMPGGERTWGAYQHYGFPYFRFFDKETMRTRPEADEGGTKTD